MKIRKTHKLITIIFGLVFMVSACSDSGDDGGGGGGNGPTGTVVWEDVNPIFQANCVGCHGGNGGFYIDTYDNATTTGDHAPDVIIAGDPANSILIQALRGTATVAAQMPKNQTPLSEDEILLIEQWITDGALETEVVE